MRPGMYPTLVHPMVRLGSAVFLSLVTLCEACAPTCYQATCDYWDGGYWGTCSDLVSIYGCDCSGCMCDGCPQSTCETPKYDPKMCPYSGNAGCDESENHAECAFDGGDCCEDTCIGSNCPVRPEGYNCKDPASVPANIKVVPYVPPHTENVDEYWVTTTTVGTTADSTVGTTTTTEVAASPKAEDMIRTWTPRDIFANTSFGAGRVANLTSPKQTSHLLPVASTTSMGRQSYVGFPRIGKNDLPPLATTTEIARQPSYGMLRIGGISFASRTSVTAIIVVELGLTFYSL